ncbi:MAG: hypothetical protein RJA20_953 [Bacteroidota bacterium]
MTDNFIFPTIPTAEYATAERCHITEILNLPSVPEASLAQARVEPGVCTANHLLKGTSEWYYILSGNGDMYIDNQLAGNVSPGDVVRIPADTPQYICNTGQSDLIFLCYCTPPFSPEDYVDMGGTE